jgi:putative DNA primase/helicase
MLEQRWLAIADLTDPTFLSGDEPPRPVIRFVAGEIPKVVDEAEEALLRANLGLYQRGAFIVRPGRVLVTVSDGREVAAQRALEVGDYAVAEAMTQAAAWEKYDARSDSWVPIDAPAKVAATYRERVGRWRLPVLAGVITAPTLRPDGTLLSASGYDAASGLLLDPCGVVLPP